MQTSNKRIAKNSLVLYFRMFISMIVGLYTSRIVLQVLGVEDYGIYGVVGGVVGLMSFLNATMSGATSRFITFELGSGNVQRLKETFSSTLLVHFIIALFIVLIAETVGLWFLCNKLVIPENRMFAAHFVYQFSILSTVFSITQVPYNACIIAHEKMDVYAYVEILNVMLKLLIVYLLQELDGDKLIIYTFLYLLVSVISVLIYRLYCLRHFVESRFHFVWNTQILKPMISFSAWDLYGNFSGVARQQGVNMLINMFFGPLLNAASSIATTVSGIVMQFATNVVVAIKPQIVKSYAQQNYDETVRLIMMGCYINFSLLIILSIPVMCEAHFLLKLWLNVVPDYAVIFCQLALAFNIFANLSSVVISGVHATGRIKTTSMILGTLYLLVIPFTYLSFSFGWLVEWLPYAINTGAVFLGMLSNAFVLSRYVKQFSFSSFFLQAVFKFAIPFVLIFLLTYRLHDYMEEGFLRLFATCCLSMFLFMLFSFWILPRIFIHQLKLMILNKLCKRV